MKIKLPDAFHRIIFFALIVSANLVNAQYLNPSSYTSLGAFDPNSNVTINMTTGTMSGGSTVTGVVSSGILIFTFDSFTLDPGISITFTNITSGSNKIAFLSKGSMTIAGNIYANASGNTPGPGGYKGGGGLGTAGTSGQNGFGPGGGTGNSNGGGGGGFGGAGGNSGYTPIAPGGSSNGDLSVVLTGGSGGGQSKWASPTPEATGGGGGGALELGAKNTLTLTSTSNIEAKGAAGNDAIVSRSGDDGNGGGSGGAILIHGASIVINSGARINVSGGSGGTGGTGSGTGGGGGGGGRIHLAYYNTGSLTNNGTLTLSGGSGGTDPSTISKPGTAGSDGLSTNASFNNPSPPPTASNNSVTISEDNNKTFSASEFNYSDPDANPLSLILIVTVPSTGTLYNDANNNNVIDATEALASSATVSKSDIDAGRLKFCPLANGTGSPYTTFTFKVNNGTAYSTSSYTMTINVTAVNDAPTSSNNTVTINEDDDKTFASTDFPFYDADAGDVLVSIQITTLESAGTLFLDANYNNIDDPGEDVILNQVIITEDISKLKFRPAANGTGHPYATFQFKVNDGIAYSESSYIMSINVTPVPDLTLTNGSDYDPAPTPNTVNNPVGRFSVAADFNGSSITAITIFFAGSGTNITNVKLWSSMDADFNFDSDIQLGTSQSYGVMVTFNGFSSSISTSAKYYFVTFDLGASIGSITSTIANNASITISGGTWAVDAAFIDAPLSANPVPLPVVLQSFTAAPQNKQVLLKWSTATEVNNYGFEIERAALETTSGQDGWVKIGFVEGAGNSNSPKDYSFTDANPSAGKVQYRLKQIDTDGGYRYYPQTAEVNISLTGIQEKQLPKEFALGQNYPNPFNPSTVISYQLPVNGHVKLSVYNALGKEVAVLVNQEKAAGFHEVKFDASNLSAGMYIYQLRINNFLSTKKLLLIK